MKMPPSEQVAGPAPTSRKVDHNLHVNTFYHVTFDMYFPSNFQVLFFPRTLCCMTHFLTFRKCYVLGSDLFVLGGGQNFDLFCPASTLAQASPKEYPSRVFQAHINAVGSNTPGLLKQRGGF